ncbi:DUF397 domain-containing protein [Actinomadura decatromicini]|uniref:DUF397 domain-containing protein n=1 Tax=Actinomadura decatromicini TaxID=2604572 RepID=A0A5D3FR49_9ACTN|nr:DUF397 domain-containing protein [Actinomadura decatromicini]TYK51267.1 DUF397 domain-containing protein [Actinomadura decatromicini]
MTNWRKSSRSNTENGACVELASLIGRVGVRDSKNPTAPALALTPDSFRTLLHNAKAGNLDLP